MSPALAGRPRGVPITGAMVKHPKVPPEPGIPTRLENAIEVYAVIDRWRARGFYDQVIARAAGVTLRTVQRARVGESGFTEQTRDLIGAVTFARLVAAATDMEMLPVIGATRRAQALGVIGWPGSSLGLPANTVSGLLSPTRQHVTAGTWRQVAAVYEKRSGTPGPDRFYRDQHRAAGWQPPLAWEENDIDDPTAAPWTPTPMTLEEQRSARRLAAIEDADYLLAACYPVDVVCSRIGMSAGAAEMLFRRAGRRDLSRQFFNLARRERTAKPTAVNRV